MNHINNFFNYQNITFKLLCHQINKINFYVCLKNLFIHFVDIYDFNKIIIYHQLRYKIFLNFLYIIKNNS